MLNYVVIRAELQTVLLEDPVQQRHSYVILTKKANKMGLIPKNFVPLHAFKSFLKNYGI